MSWDIRDARSTAPADANDDTSSAPAPASPALVPTVAMLLTGEAWEDDPLGLDTFPEQDLGMLRQYGLVPPGHWQVLRRLMTRGISETS